MEGIWWTKVKIVSCFNSRYQYVNNTAYELISKSNNLSIIKSTNQELYKEKNRCINKQQMNSFKQNGARFIP